MFVNTAQNGQFKKRSERMSYRVNRTTQSRYTGKDMLTNFQIMRQKRSLLSANSTLVGTLVNDNA